MYWFNGYFYTHGRMVMVTFLSGFTDKRKSKLNFIWTELTLEFILYRALPNEDVNHILP